MNGAGDAAIPSTDITPASWGLLSSEGGRCFTINYKWRGSEGKARASLMASTRGLAWRGEVRAGKLEELTCQLGTERKLRAERRKEKHVQRP